MGAPARGGVTSPVPSGVSRGFTRFHAPFAAVWKTTVYGVAAWVFLFQACGLFHQAPVEVIAWTPQEELPADPASCVVSLTFSAAMSETSTEEAFSLRRDGEETPGRFSWEGAVMTFVPDGGLWEGGVYTMSLSQEAEDEYGNDLAIPFRHRFYFSDDRERPSIVSVTPLEQERITDDFKAIAIMFSEPVDRGSLYESFSLTPAAELSFIWSEGDTCCTILPAEPYAAGTAYTAEIGTSLTDRAGNSMGGEFRRVFYVDDEGGIPRVLYAGNVEETAPLEPDDPGDGIMTVVEVWETFWDLRIRFSGQVPVDDIREGVELEPFASYELNAGFSGSSSVADIVLDEHLAYDALYTLTVPGNPETVYHFRTNGTRSRPPQVARVEFLARPEEIPPAVEELEHFGVIDLSSYPPHRPEYTAGFFDLHLILAEDALPNIPAFMEAFSVSLENNCALLSPLAVEWQTYSGPPPEPAAGETTVRVWVSIEDDPAPGLIILKLSKDYTDSVGNRQEEDWHLFLNEATF